MAQSNSDASLLRHWLPPWCQLAQSHYDATQVIADCPLGIDIVILLGALKTFDSAAIYIEIHSTIQASRPYPVRVTIEASFLTALQNSRLYGCQRLGMHVPSHSPRYLADAKSPFPDWDKPFHFQQTSTDSILVCVLSLFRDPVSLVNVPAWRKIMSFQKSQSESKVEAATPGEWAVFAELQRNGKGTGMREAPSLLA
ncbi:hypothetical protein AGABI2DRAFT_118522 [Agaricus bisporus var. bisporus H97]|uniref:hypothetical protein n=1 Tax=Agaricus bisporus var. bisporus (strain H97 / ATCC MYA-4626 / FGSC 10389) TaxID=936046 RepID=UPI00029F7FEE|nr:hypothetical protein AGABI2DRAFT_118522 [Agaricus bisporus var. bisporus H97]EKV46332.1 hypothetical protein AGABI2DRAFT_118522 [Agaricus bisporus var. bisporus H97]